MLYNYNGKHVTKCLCDCDCGAKDIIREAYALKKSKMSSCGCMKHQIVIDTFADNIDGMKFGRLKILETLWDADKPKVKCVCDCGNIKILSRKDVKSGHTKSCGCLSSETTSRLNMVDHSGEISDYGVKIIEPYKLNEKSQWLWKCECGICNSIFYEIPARVMNNHIKSCGCLKQSARELFIENFLNQEKIEYEKEYTFANCKGLNGYVLRFDFALMKNGEVFYLLEYDGEQHFKPVEIWGGIDAYKRTIERDSIKNKYCKDNNIKLLRIPYTYSENEIKKAIINIIYP